MPVSKKRKKKRSYKPAGPPVSKKALATKKRKISKRQIIIYVFSILIILSFALSFLFGTGGRANQTLRNITGGNTGGILFTPVPGNEDAGGEDNVQPDNDISSESDTEN